MTLPQVQNLKNQRRDSQQFYFLIRPTQTWNIFRKNQIFRCNILIIFPLKLIIIYFDRGKILKNSA